MDVSDPVELEQLLWLVVGIIIGLYVIAFIRRGVKGDLKQFNYAAASIFFALCFDSLKRLIMEGNIYMIFTSNIVLAAFCIPLVKFLEEQVLRNKKVYLTYSATSLVILYVVGVLTTRFQNRDIMNWLIILPFALELGTILYVYAFMVKNTTGVIRKSSFLILLGLLVTVVFWALHAQFGRYGTSPNEGLKDLLGILSPVFILVGLSIAALGFFKYRPNT